jgi:hypothetical protein
MTLVSGISIPVSASAPPNTLFNGSEFMPFWTMINHLSNGLEIESNGKALMFSQITGYSGQVESIRISAYLQRYKNGTWVTIKNWTQDYEGSSALWTKSWYVNKGYYYRLTTYFYVYGNGSQESTILISGVKYY